MESTFVSTVTWWLVLFHLVALGAADDWPHWRGPARNDICGEDSGWSAGRWQRFQILWKQNVGEGASSPLVINDRLFVLGWRDGRDILTCLETLHGKQLWSIAEEGPRYSRTATGDEGLYSGPTSTPEYDETTGRLYTLSCDGVLVCRDVCQKGNEVWRVNLFDRYEILRRPKIHRSAQRDYGFTASPLVYGDWLLVEVGAQQGTVAALEKSSGKQVWISEAKQPAGHTGGIVPMQVEGVPCAAVMTTDGLLVLRLDSRQAGRTVAQYPWRTDFANNVATPTAHKNSLLITSDYNHHAMARIDITLRGANCVWEQPFPSRICSPVIDGERIYFANLSLHCLDFETGKQLWEGGTFGDAGSCVITSDRKLVVWGGRGKLALVNLADGAPAHYTEIASIDHLATTDVWPHVVLADGHIFCKDRDGNVVCLK